MQTGEQLMKSHKQNIVFWKSRNIEGLAILPSYIVITFSIGMFGPSSPLAWIILFMLGLWLTSLFYSFFVITRVGMLKRFTRMSICLVIFLGQIAGISIAYLLA